MANKFNNGTAGIAINPISVDTAWTAGTIPAALTGIAGGGPQRFRLIKWVGPTTAAHVCSIQDINGNQLLKGVCAVANQEVVLWDNPGNPYVLKQSQWVVDTIQSGTLLLYK